MEVVAFKWKFEDEKEVEKVCFTGKDNLGGVNSKRAISSVDTASFWTCRSFCEVDVGGRQLLTWSPGIPSLVFIPLCNLSLSGLDLVP